MEIKLDNLDLAIQLSALGWYVFPMGQNKRPMIPTAHPEGDDLRGVCRGECGKLGHGYHDAVMGFDAVYDYGKRRTRQPQRLWVWLVENPGCLWWTWIITGKKTGQTDSTSLMRFWRKTAKRLQFAGQPKIQRAADCT
jgi:hypothetical protein